MEFTKVSSWKTGDSFEDLLRDLSSVSTDGTLAIANSTACDPLFGQSWTIDSNKSGQWEHFAKGYDCLDKVNIMVKTTISDLMNLIDDSVLCHNKSIITFNDRIIGRVKYKTEEEIKNWLSSLGAFPIEKVQDLYAQYALFKRRNNDYGVDYTIEDEVRCLAWGVDDDADVITFQPFNPSIFSGYVVDPNASKEISLIVREELINLGVAPNALN